MKISTIFQPFSLLAGVIVFLIISCGKEEKSIDEQHATAKLAVVDATATSNTIPSSIHIDGLENGSNTIDVSEDHISYSDIQAGTRSIQIDNFTDTITLTEGKHHSLMVFSSDSVSLVIDDFDSEAPKYSKIRWMLTGDDPIQYQVDFTVDSTWKNHEYQSFIPVEGKKQVGVILRRNNFDRTFLAQSTISFDVKKVVTMKIVVSPDKQSYTFEPLVHEVIE
ncbi:hypothetical protein SAMN05216436_1302 [bacterium A37T11]|nr:hypothetical protein SAMN05216436_1302 [bacterium A37T11]